MSPVTQASFEQDSLTSAQFMHRRSRCYGLTAGISLLGTAIAGNEAFSQIESSNPTDVFIGAGLGFVALAGSVTVLGCAQIAADSYRWARAIERGE